MPILVDHDSSNCLGARIYVRASCWRRMQSCSRGVSDKKALPSCFRSSPISTIRNTCERKDLQLSPDVTWFILCLRRILPLGGESHALSRTTGMSFRTRDTSPPKSVYTVSVRGKTVGLATRGKRKVGQHGLDQATGCVLRTKRVMGQCRSANSGSHGRRTNEAHGPNITRERRLVYRILDVHYCTHDLAYSKLQHRRRYYMKFGRSLSFRQIRHLLAPTMDPHC